MLLLKPAKFGDITYGNVITGINTGLGVVHVLGGSGGGAGSQSCHAPSGCFQCKMTGQGDIAGCLDALAAQIYPLRGSDGWIQTDDVYQVYQRALAAISNPNLFRQGDAYLTQFQQVLQRQISHYQSSVGSAASGNTVQVIQGSTVDNLGAIAGIPQNYIIIGGIAVLGLLFFIKQ